VGGFGFSGNYSTDNFKDPSYQVYGVGVGVGAKYAGGKTHTKTFSFSIYCLKMMTAVGGRF